MENTKFDQPVTVKGGAESTVLALRGPRDAANFLLNGWLGKRTEKHRAALQACSDVIDRGKPAMVARRAVVAAVREAGVLIDEKAAAGS